MKRTARPMMRMRIPATAEPAMTDVRDEARTGGELRNDVTIGVTI
jgi:hypothetical protein